MALRGRQRIGYPILQNWVSTAGGTPLIDDGEPGCRVVAAVAVLGQI